ncbi:MAG: DUF362 domain-containing protein [Candidatus Omnitrophota bacterium]
MKSKVYFTAVDNSDNVRLISAKLKSLLDESGLLGFIKKDERVAVKMHFGEEDNTGFVPAQYLGIICEGIIKQPGRQAKPFLIDTNTLYRGKRMNSRQHIRLAYSHGFTKDKTGVEVIIPEDSQNTSEVAINAKLIKTAKISTPFLAADAILGVAHFKGHLMAGFGGALKNLGMGCATREGKLAQHSDLSPFVIIQNCAGCGACLKACPAGAVSIQNKKARIDSARCIGCAACVAVCPNNAIDVNWDAGGDTIQEKMVEYASAVLKDKKGRAAFINFALKITAECDCLAKDDPRIAPDIGIFASTDPVSIDKACLDLINNACGRDVFKEAHPKRDGLKQLQYASALGLGSLEYELIRAIHKKPL